MMGILAALHRYPVKSMSGESVDSVPVTVDGLVGDRRFAVMDEAGNVGSAKHPRKWAALLGCRAQWNEAGDASVELPDGTRLRSGDVELDKRLSMLLGRAVFVSDPLPEGGNLEREVPDYPGGVPDRTREHAFRDPTGAKITVGSVAAGTFFDFGTVHAVTTATLLRLRTRQPGGDFDPRRFRPNLLLDTGSEAAFTEDDWPGRIVRVGEVVLRATVPTPRCVIPTLAQAELPADPGIMRTVAREHRIPVLDLGRLACVGAYLEVVEPGVAHLGDPVTVI